MPTAERPVNSNHSPMWLQHKKERLQNGEVILRGNDYIVYGGLGNSLHILPRKGIVSRGHVNLPNDINAQPIYPNNGHKKTSEDVLHLPTMDASHYTEGNGNGNKSISKPKKSNLEPVAAD